MSRPYGTCGCRVTTRKDIDYLELCATHAAEFFSQHAEAMADYRRTVGAPQEHKSAEAAGNRPTDAGI